MSRLYQMCTKTVMDTTDPDITFDSEGICNYYHYYNKQIKPLVDPSPAKQQALDGLLATIKEKGRGRDYDCLIGISGGVDSSYLAYYLKKIAGLRPLAVHLDTGWNSEMAVGNIESVLKVLDIDLYTYVVDWEEMKDLQVSFLKAGVANQDIPQDHAIFSALYHVAKEKGIKFIIGGQNMATESILPKAWGHDAMDLMHIKSIHKRFGKLRRLKNYPTLNFLQHRLLFPYFFGIKAVRFLNLIDYNKAEAMRLLEKELGWRYYGGKHYESRFTKFFQSYFLPTRFGFDKRKAHLSSLIVSGQLTREEALVELKKPLYNNSELNDDKEYIRKKLDLSETDFDQLLTQPLKTYRDYPSNEVYYTFIRDLYVRCRGSKGESGPRFILKF